MPGIRLFSISPLSATPTPPLNRSYLPFLYLYNSEIIKFVKAIFANVAKERNLVQHTHKYKFLRKVLEHLNRPFPNKTTRFYRNQSLLNL